MTPPFPPFPPGPPPPPFGFGGFGRGHHRGPHSRKRRGDVRAAVLALLADRPMHGYEMIQEIAARSGGAWKPSPGSVYPTLQLLADEGLIRGVVHGGDGDGGKRLFELTDEGREAHSKLSDTPPWEEAAAGVDPVDRSLREALGGLATAVMGVAQTASADQKSRAVDILDQARRQLYAILGEDTPR